ncbi:MAG TPA: helix-turn-helix domain-containing protein [Paenirhodobacter sp.]
MTVQPTAPPTQGDLAIDIGRVSIRRVGQNICRLINTGLPEDAEGFYDIVIPCNGPISFCQGDMSGEVAPDEYVLLNRHAFYELSASSCLSHWRITMPASDIRARIYAVNDHLGKRFDQDRRMAAMLGRFVDMIGTTFGDSPPPNPEKLATEIVGFIVLVLSAEQGKDRAVGRNSRYRLKERVIGFVESNLGDAELTPKQIASANRISLSYLYSLFSDNNTTVSQFIQARRLQRAYELLVGDPGGALTVSEIAYQVGFKNTSHFSRTFSRHFRIAPRDARQSGLQTRSRPESLAQEPSHVLA